MGNYQTANSHKYDNQTKYDSIHRQNIRLLKYNWCLDSRNHTYRICRCCTLHFETSNVF